MKNRFGSFHLSEQILMPIILVLIIIGSVIFYIKPTWSKYQDTKKQVSKEQTEVSQLETKKEALANLSSDTLLQQLNEVRAAVPETKNIAGVIAGLSKLTQENSLSIDTLNVKPGKIASDSASQAITMQVSIRGDLKNIAAFMQRLAQVRRILGLQKFSGTAATTDTNGGFSANIDIAFYTLPLPTSLGSSYADPLPVLDSQKRDFITKLASFPVYTDVNGAIALPTPAPSSQATSSANVQHLPTVQTNTNNTSQPTTTNNSHLPSTNQSPQAQASAAPASSAFVAPH